MMAVSPVPTVFPYSAVPLGPSHMRRSMIRLPTAPKVKVVARPRRGYRNGHETLRPMSVRPGSIVG